MTERVDGLGRPARLAGLAISALFLVAIAWWALHQPAPRAPSSAAAWGLLALAVATYALATAARGERWLWLMRRDGAAPSRVDAYALTAVGYMGNNVLPARAGDAMRVYLQAPRAGTGMRNVLGTLIAERLLDALTLLSLFVLLAYGLLRGIDSPDADTLLLAISLLIAAAITAGAITFLLRRRERIRRMVAFLTPLAGATRDLRGGHGLRMLGMTVAIWALEAGTYLAVAHSVDLEMSPVEALYVVAVASVFVLIPSGPGYVGTLDAAVIFGARAIGASGSLAFSFLLALRFVLLVPITLFGLALLLTRYGGWRTGLEASSQGGSE